MSTDAFSISCPTCQAALRVRDASAIGQIFACPRCGSMVMVEAPVEESANASSAEDHASSEAEFASGNSRGGLLLGFASLAAVAFVGVVGFTWHAHRPVDPASPSPVTQLPARSDPTHAAQAAPTVSLLEGPHTALEPTEETTRRESTPPSKQRTPTGEANPDLPPIGSPSPASATADKPASDPPATARSNPAQRTPPTQDSRRADELPNSLSNLASLLSGRPAAAEPGSQPETTSDLAVVALANKAAQSSSSSVPDEDEPSLAEKLEFPLRSFRFEKVPLIDFCRTVMQLGGVPIQIDPAALRQSGNVLETPVSVAGVDQTTMDVLRAALEPIRMLPVMEEYGVRISSPRTEDRRAGQLSLFVGDLQSGRGRAIDPVELVTTLVQPATWAADGGEGTIELKGERLSIQHTHAVRVETLVLLEKLRAARSLRARKKLPKRYVSLDTRWSRVNRYLQRSLNIGVWQEQPLVEVVQQLETTSGLRIVLDWAALTKVGVTPQQGTVLYARDTPAAEIFQRFLGLLDDAVLLPISGDAVQITTLEAMQAHPYVEFYSLKMLGASGREQLAQLPASMPHVIDPAAQMALVLAPAEIHRKLTR